MNGELERSWLFYKERTPHSLSETFKCDFVGIQTQNLLIRSQMLYSVEPRDHFLNAMQRYAYFLIQQNFFRIFFIRLF